jgi:endonuclease/exonuclease/phosphatase family metal-dependent hydrolase
MKMVLKLVLTIAVLSGLTLLTLILYATLTDYKPDKKTVVFKSSAPTVIPAGAELAFMIWNIGYCGLSADMDFFYDGGKQVRTSKKNVRRNIEKTTQFISEKQASDFILLQEVDRDSGRSYYFDEFNSISKLLKNFQACFAANYDVKFVPLPPTSPLGKVFSGLATFGKQVPKSCDRYSFPGNYGWPKGLFMLDRCFLVNRYAVSDGKELLVINTHNSAYDDGSLRKGQMDYLKAFLTDEYAKGNYIIVGGDWNQCAPRFVPGVNLKNFDTVNYSLIDKDYLPPDWTWFYDDKTPSNRRLQIPYDPEKSLITVIDYYLLSPNIQGVSKQTVNLDFQHSDHQPVLATMKLKLP